MDMKQCAGFLKRGFLFGLLTVTGFMFVDTAFAANPYLNVSDDGFEAKYVGQSVPDPIRIKAGETVRVDYLFLNAGTQIWENSGAHFVSAYTVEPKYRDSDFKGKNWRSSIQTGMFSGPVKPGEKGLLPVDFKAPNEPGIYKEEFYLAAEDKTWFEGGYFYAEFEVIASDSIVPVQEQKSVTTSTQNSIQENTATTGSSIVGTKTQSYRANRFLAYPESISAKGGEQITVTVAYQNVGDTPWTSYTLVSGNTTQITEKIPSGKIFGDGTWKNAFIITQKDDVSVLKDQIIRESFIIRAPREEGTYTFEMQLMTNGVLIEGAGFSVPVTVTQTASAQYVEPFLEVGELNIVSVMELERPRLLEEPRIRVGLWKSPDTITFVSNEDDYLIWSGDERKGVLSKDQKAKIYYSNGLYYFSMNDFSFSSKEYIRLAPATNPHSVFTLENYQRTLSYKKGMQFNEYRGAFELRLTNEKTPVLYGINDLFFEDYIAGIGETSNAAPKEYIKAILTAARTYAYYTKEYTSKHDDRNFDVVATTVDQLYLGYVSEKDMNNVADAARETRGYMVTYKGEIVITPYFAQSSGRTKDWTDVWGGTAKPWLVPVSAEYDKEDRVYLLGHGVGMSARDTASRAKATGAPWQDLLRHYYTGTEIELIY